MAREVIERLLDDMEDDRVAADAGTIPFGLDGRNYSIDLSTANATKLRALLAPWIANARGPENSTKRRGGSRGTTTGYSKEQREAIRHWAQSQGMPVGDRGVIPASAVEAYEVAHRA